MRRASRYLVASAVLFTMAAVGTYAAHAEWAVPASKGTVSLPVSKMPNGKKPSVAKQSKTAVVSWSALELEPGVKMDRYIITGHSQDIPAKPKIVHEVAASGATSESVTFTAAEVAGGKWRWTVIPRFASWAGAESKLSEALKFPAAAAGALVEEPPAVGTPALISSAPPSAPATESTSKPAVVPPTDPPTAPSQDDTAPPPASSPAEAEPPVKEKEPEPSASGSAAEDISE